MSKTASNNAQRYMSFSLGKEEYAIPLLNVKEVIAVPEMTPVPQNPSYFLGIMNLRGQVLSVIDLRLKFGIKPVESAEKAVVICDVGGLCIGVVVDSVNQVLSPLPEELTQRPEIEGVKGADYVVAVYRAKQRLVLLLDIAKALSLEDQRAIQATAKHAA